jgi:hypothetical protein
MDSDLPKFGMGRMELEEGIDDLQYYLSRNENFQRETDQEMADENLNFQINTLSSVKTHLQRILL